MKKISILGSTGSIGLSALNVIEKNPPIDGKTKKPAKQYFLTAKSISQRSNRCSSTWPARNTGPSARQWVAVGVWGSSTKTRSNINKYVNRQYQSIGWIKC